VAQASPATLRVAITGRTTASFQVPSGFAGSYYSHRTTILSRASQDGNTVPVMRAVQREGAVAESEALQKVSVLYFGSKRALPGIVCHRCPAAPNIV
jgi:hypothetical protein